MEKKKQRNKNNRLSHTLNSCSALIWRMISITKGRHHVKACMTTKDQRPKIGRRHAWSEMCSAVLITYWSQVCWKRARGAGGGGARRRRGVPLPVTQGALALADEGLLVPLHPLQLLVGTHLAPLLRWLPGVEALQGTFWSLLGAKWGEKRDELIKK